jgi:ABC-type multidrug transport system permease subunit
MLPVEMLPGWALKIGRASPLRYLIEALGGTLTAIHPWSAVGLGALVLAAAGTVAFTVAVRLVKWG